MSPRSPRSRRNRNKPRSQPRQPDDLHDIETFCAANRISQSYFFTLMREGRGPKIIKLGKRVLISPESEAAWRRQREAETMQAAE